MSRRVLAWAGVAVLVVIAVGLIGWRVHGGRWVTVRTPSMGTEAPVGTLLWVAPVDFDDLAPGDLITFRPAGSSSSYSHLVSAVNDDGTLSTQGRISAPDPWRIGRDEVIGKVALRWPGVGWLVTAGPLLALGAGLLWSVVRRLRDPDVRLPVAVIGGAVVIAAALVVYRPLTRADQLAFVPVEGGARATYVSTGLLPVRLSAHGGDSVVLRDGEVGSVHTTTPDRIPGRFAVTIHPAVGGGYWLAIIGICFVPALLSGLRRSPPKLA